MNLEVIEQTDQYSHIKLVGRLDILGIDQVQTKFLGHTAARKLPAIVDLSGLEFLASLGIRMFVDAAKTLKSAGAAFVLLSPQPLVEKSITASGLGVILRMAQSLDEAKQLAGLPTS